MGHEQRRQAARPVLRIGRGMTTLPIEPEDLPIMMIEP